MSTTFDVKVTHELDDGRILMVKYQTTHIPGFLSGLPEDCYPDEDEDTDPQYFIDGNEVEYQDIPAELDDIFAAMAEPAAEDDSRFKVTKKEYDPY